MIIELLLDVIYNLFSILTTPINIPMLPDSFGEFIGEVYEYLCIGVQILAVYTPIDFIRVLFGLVVAIDVGIKLYGFVMWILKKIPVISIS